MKRNINSNKESVESNTPQGVRSLESVSNETKYQQQQQKNRWNRLPPQGVRSIQPEQKRSLSSHYSPQVTSAALEWIVHQKTFSLASLKLRKTKQYNLIIPCPHFATVWLFDISQCYCSVLSDKTFYFINIHLQID
ncbi:hypothetical protein Bpfe_016338 [Biomphalaria pfeifferi]|uniref:Uncharacterized protein n=1 Tax=Biomphalaria pfeifferi TaxID=112525 RepID=A0AAD8F8T8_BIOPF|nr:hypothetical protein Bpfe_016338 [Biomphalaria pfeifferi]